MVWVKLIRNILCSLIVVEIIIIKRILWDFIFIDYIDEWNKEWDWDIWGNLEIKIVCLIKLIIGYVIFEFEEVLDC